MNTKILFTDLDATLLDDRKNISQHTHDKLEEMLQKGHKLVLASGRPINSILRVLDKLNLHGEGIYATAYNGAMLYDCAKKEAIIEHQVPIAVAQKIFEKAQSYGLHIQTYTDEHIVSCADDAEIAFYTKHVAMKYSVGTDLYKELQHGPYKLLTISLDDRAKLEAFREDVMNSELGNTLDSTFSNAYYLEFYCKESGKGNALKALCKYLEIPLENSVAAGDEENDLCMVTAAGTGVAMCNGNPLLKNQADYVTKNDNNHDGMAEIIDKFILA
ncbi:MAG: HAD family phosphatase [Lachnospiraceae bacterium]|nr:HAD family phosphatase [Lachnospiraceae bacterium]